MRDTRQAVREISPTHKSRPLCEARTLQSLYYVKQKGRCVCRELQGYFSPFVLRLVPFCCKVIFLRVQGLFLVLMFLALDDFGWDVSPARFALARARDRSGMKEVDRNPHTAGCRPPNMARMWSSSPPLWLLYKCKRTTASEAIVNMHIIA
jgi:hypothetical protein